MDDEPCSLAKTIISVMCLNRYLTRNADLHGLAGHKLPAIPLQCVSYRGRMCGSHESLGDLGVRAGCRLDVGLRLRGGGGDGGATGAESRVSYLEMYASKKPDKVRHPPDIPKI